MSIGNSQVALGTLVFTVSNSPFKLIAVFESLSLLLHAS